MPDFAVSTAFKAKDKVSPAFNRMNKNAGKFGRGASAAFRKAGKQGSLFGKIVKGILVAGAVRRGFSLLTSGIREATTQFISFDDAIKSSTARFREININTKAGRQAIISIGKIARKVGAETEFTATQAAKGMEVFALAGLGVKQSISLLPGTVDLATAASIELDRAIEIGTKSLGAFGLMTKNTTQLQKNFTRISDVMGATATSSQTNIDEVFEAVRTGGITFFNAGQSIETFNALVGKMADKTIVGEKAGTALRNVMLKLANPSREAAFELDFLGVKIADQKGDYRDVIDIIGDFEKKLKTMGSKQRAATLDIIFGKRSIDAFNSVLNIGSKSLRSYRDDLIDSGGSAARMAEIMRLSLGKRLAALKSAAIEVGFKFLDAFKKKGVGSIDRLTIAVRNFNIQPVINMVGSAVEIFKDFFDIVSPVTDLIFNLNKSEVKGILGIAAAIKALAVATALLDVALAANPFVLAGLGIAAVAGGAAALQKRFGIFDFLSGTKRKSGFSNLHLFGPGGRAPGATVPSHIPPNRQDLFRSNQNVSLSGRIDLAGAPEGSTFELFKAPRIQTQVLGANP